MGTLFRSEEMKLVHIYMQVEAAHDVLEELGKLSAIQFRDLCPNLGPFHRHFTAQIRGLDEMSRRLKQMELEIRKLPPNTTSMASILPPSPTAVTMPFEELEHLLQEKESDLKQIMESSETLVRAQVELTQYQEVLLRASEMIDQSFFGFQSSSDTELELSVIQSPPSLRDNGAGIGLVEQQLNTDFNFTLLKAITGVIDRSKITTFERIMWRLSRGNMLFKHVEISNPIIDPVTGEIMKKNVFLVFLQGSNVRKKAEKVCETFGCQLYPFPEKSADRTELIKDITTRLKELTMIIQRTNEHKAGVLSTVQINASIWKERIRREKAIYATMNLFNYDVGRKCVFAEGWCPTKLIPEVQLALQTGSDKSGAAIRPILSTIDTTDMPPTLFLTNKFTQSFQSIVDAYGVARYQEVNPGVFTIITFPFLFGVMFGDIGHGVMMFLFSLSLLSIRGSVTNEMLKTCYEGRYVLVLMSLFSIYVGFIYNECFSIPLNLGGSSWEWPAKEPNARIERAHLIPGHHAYLFGVDPNWAIATNSLTFYNSLKMKLSVILGVTQMTVGIILSWFNARRFKLPYNIYFEFIPQLVFLSSIFGYLCFLILLKWSIDWRTLESDAPRLLTIMIQMFLSPTGFDSKLELYGGQKAIQIILLLIAVFSVPVMLFTKPLLLRRDHNKKMAEGHHERLLEDHEAEGNEHVPEEEEFEFGEVFVHQIIHTIEFVLGAISNTASYLRLWALSLAHSELSRVFWERILTAGLSYGIPGAFIGFGAWAVMTVAVLLMMESLSAFLHALRLHWVEFQNKFYAGDGYQFAPYSFATFEDDSREDSS
eukprot:TRINITY_DN3565_c0_g1_i2.p1 TRINITY_DN3565_c0_g1~~TRINITY_DN3565_c0_g1_i2.p1  ORF type:complete len:823 (+),score=120.07 TRINITY_DN3565_c0_g1_i2:218-2686(+)